MSTSRPDFRRPRKPKLEWVGLSEEQVSELRGYIPKSYFHARTEDQAGTTDGERLLSAVGMAFDLDDIWEPVTVSFGPVSKDAEAIATASRNLLAQIRKADNVARFEIDEYAEDGVCSLSKTAGRCINFGEAVEVASKPIEKREIAKRCTKIDHSLLASVWDLVSDLQSVALAVSQSLPIDRNLRPERMNSDRLASSLVTFIAASLNRDPPRTPWFCALISRAAAYRGLKIGKATTLKHIELCAAPTRSSTKRAGYILKG